MTDPADLPLDPHPDAGETGGVAARLGDRPQDSRPEAAPPERLILIEFRWKSLAGVQPVLYLERRLLH